ncbi:MAG: c-type cytochrome [Polyangiales bacterium]
MAQACSTKPNVSVLGWTLLTLCACNPARRGEAGPDNAAATPAATRAPSSSAAFTPVHRLKLATLRDVPTQTMKVRHDAVYGRPKRYRGYSLQAILPRLKRPDAPAGVLTVLFHCSDRYAARMPLTLVEQSPGLIALADLDAAEGKRWIPFQHGRKRITPAPAYLVWQKVQAGDRRFKWPHNLVALEIIDAREDFSAAKPADPAHGRDYAVFKDNCIHCHSVNLAGGRVGPELNVPKNILEYWREAEFRAFVQQPSAYRAESAMPSQSHLSTADLDAIVRYLRVMQQQKIKLP